MAQLAALHPHAPMPAAPTTVVPLQISRASLRKVISSLPQGSAPGPRGWTFEHIQAVTQDSAAGMAVSSVRVATGAAIDTMLCLVKSYKALALCATILFNHWCNVDTVVTHPASYSMRCSARREPGAAAKVAEAKKRSTHGVGAVGHAFVPFALESYVRLGLDAFKLLKGWADSASGADFVTEMDILCGSNKNVRSR
jgi:hypothetical protein